MNAPLQPLRCLLVEDSEDDARLLLRTLRASGYAVKSERVDNPEAMRAVLQQGRWDLVISDFSMPRFSGLDALKILRASGHDLPFILVSAAIGEETAVNAMRAGAHDYLLKDKLARLGPAVERELANAADRRARRLAEGAMHQSDALLVAAGRMANFGGWSINLAEGKVVWSDEVAHIHAEPPGFSPTLAQGINYYAPEWRKKITAVFTACARDGTPYDEELEIITVGGRRVWVRAVGMAQRNASGRIYQVQGAFQDISASKHAEAIDLFLAQAGVSPSGESFFPALARFLAKILQMDYVCIDRLEGDALNATTLAVWNDGRFADNLTYALKDTPCGEVVRKNFCCYPAHVVQSFRKDPALQELRAESFVGVTLLSHTGHPIGLIALIGRHPLTNRVFAETTLTRVAPRAAGELERLMVEEELKTSEERYRTLFSSMMEGFVLFEVLLDGQNRPSDLRILEVNPAFEAQTGLRNVRGRLVRELVPQLEDSWFEIYGKVALTGEPAQFENEAKELQRWFAVSAYRVGEGAHRKVGVMFHDITARKRAETALRESERFNRATLDALAAHIAVLDSAGRILATNDAWRNFAAGNGANWTTVSEGVSYLEVCERAAREGNADAARIAAGIRAVAEGHQVEWFFEYPCHSPTQERWFYCTVRRFPGEGPVRVVVAHENISPLKEAQAALQESEGRYRLFFERNPLPMWVYDSTTLTILAANEAAIRNYGYTAEQYRHLTFPDLHNPEDVPALLAHLAASEADGVSTSETRHRKQDGTLIHTEVFSRPLTYGGRPARLAMAADITEKKLVQEKFLRAQRLESLGMLAAGIAHDLNNVLAPIMFAAPLLQGSLSNPRDQKVLDTLAQCANRGQGLVKQILGFVGATSGEFQTLQIKHLARDIIGVIEETFPKSITLETHVPSDLWSIRGDATQVHQVLLNLFVNARDAMPQGGRLRLIVSNCRLDAAQAAALPGAQVGSWLRIEIADTGTGIPPEVMDHIWEPFFTTKARGKGTGLGLPTVRGIVASHHGFLAINSQVGRGTSFHVYFPTTEPETNLDLSITVGARSQPAGQGQLILVVDDDEAIRYLTAEILTCHGYRVTRAEDGVQALTVYNLRPKEIALVITDVDMPRLNGAALARALRRIKPDIRVLAMSGMGPKEGDGSEVTAIQPLVNGFLLKPFLADALLQAVHRLLCLPADR